jgi:probable lipoprotein (TIGR04455 family)
MVAYCINLAACSHFHHRTAATSTAYPVQLKMVICTPKEPQLGEDIARLARDLLSLRTNYVITQTSVQCRDAIELCQAHDEGLLMLAVSQHERDSAQTLIKMKASLYACENTPHFLWQRHCRHRASYQEHHLSQLIEQSSTASKSSIAAIFGCLKQITEGIPNPKLNNHQIEEKIQIESSRE